MQSRDYHHGDLRRALLAAARTLVASRGAPRVSLRAIAREAGVSPAAPYHHFQDRESILAAVAGAGFSELEAAMEEATRGADESDPLRRLQGAGIAYVRYAVANPEVYRLMFSGLLSDRRRFPELKERSDAAFAVLIRLLGRGDTSGGDRGDLPAVALATWSTVHGLALLLIEGLLREETGSLEAGEVAREVTLVLGRGLRGYAVGGAGDRLGRRGAHPPQP